MTSQDNKLNCDTSVRAEDRIETGTAVDSSYLTGLMSWMNGTETNLPEQQTRTKRPIVFRNLESAASRSQAPIILPVLSVKHLHWAEGVALLEECLVCTVFDPSINLAWSQSCKVEAGNQECKLIPGYTASLMPA